MCSWSLSCKEDAIGEFEGPPGLGAAGAAGIVRPRRLRAKADHLDRTRRIVRGGIERVRAVRQRDDEIHLRAQVDEIAGTPLRGMPRKAALILDADRRE